MIDRSFTDVLLVTTAGDWNVPDTEWDEHPPVDLPFDLGGGVSLDRLPDSTAYMDGFELTAAAAYTPARQYGQRHAFIRRDAPGNRVAWDPDERIMGAVALSRLVRPNDADAHYAGRVENHADGSTGIWPVDNGFRAYRLLPNRRTWLDQEDAEALRDLLERWRADRDRLPPRIRHALWLHEYAGRIKYLEIRFPHVVTALEALVNTDSGRLGDQFRQRVEQLAAAIGVEGVDPAMAKEGWRLRSRWTHGEQVRVTDVPALANQLDSLERVLGGVIRRAIEDNDVRGWFQHRGTIRARLPVRIDADQPQDQDDGGQT